MSDFERIPVGTLAPVQNDWRGVAKLSPAERAKIKHNDPRLDAFAGEVEKRYQLPPGLIESVKNAGERTNTGQVSPMGAKGVMQFIDSTRAQYEHDVNDPLASIDASGRYFKDLLKQYNGNARAALAHYNGGTKNGKAVLAGQRPISPETQGYLQRIQQYMMRKANGQ